MTGAGSRTLNRVTKVTHKETGMIVVIDNSDIPINAPPRSHKMQREIAMQIMGINLGKFVNHDECTFEFSVKDVK